MSGRQQPGSRGIDRHTDGQGRPADSAGQAWAGKSIPSHGFAGDTGEADAVLEETLVTNHERPSAESEVALLSRVAAVRWLVPVVALATEVEQSGDHAVDTRSDMAAVILTTPDGTRALPMFTSLAELARWDASARPVPVGASAAARAAIGEECQTLLVDVASEHATVLRPSMVWALAQGRPWQPAHLDPQVARAVTEAVAHEEAVVGHEVTEGLPLGAGVLRVVLRLTPGLERDDVAAVATRIGERIAADGETRARIDALTFALEAAT
ncbi:MAG: SseB family protein [Micrococcales bacterium]|nr:SseB family protein [Micrococcales bacterium]